MKKKSKRIASLLIVACMLVAMFTFGAAAKSTSGIKNGISYTATMNFDRRYMEVIFLANSSANLKFEGYAKCSLGLSEETVPCNYTATRTIIGKTVNPKTDSLQFYYGLEQYYINSSYVTSLVQSLPRL